MIRCKSCSAPLLANVNICAYCQVRNDIDLQGRQNFSVDVPESDRICPHCHIPLQTIKLDLKEAIYIERCETCFGLFFDPGEIEQLLDSSVSNVFDINLHLMQNINRDHYQKNKPVKYIKCPVCQAFMRRINFGYHSGVVIDRCNKHGVWLDNGEITHLMEWKKAGGELLDTQEKQKNEFRKKQEVKQERINSTITFDSPRSDKQRARSLEFELLESVSSMIMRLFS